MHGTLFDDLQFRQADHYTLPRVRQFYKLHGMRPQAPRGEAIFIASHRGQLIAALRLSPVDTVFLLRSLCVATDYRGQGVASALLDWLQGELSQIHCYSFPYQHLRDFYGRAGFVPCEPSEAPDPVAARFSGYLAQGRDICLMRYRHD